MTTPTMMRRIVTDTLRAEPRKRPLPEVWTYQLGYAIEEAQHRKASQPAPSPPKPAPPKSQPSSAAKAVSAPPRSPAPTQVSSPPARGSSDKTLAITALLAVVAVVLVLIIMFIAANSHSGSVSSSSSSTSPSATSSADEATTSDTPSLSTTAPPTWAMPAYALQGADRDNDTSCANGGFRLSDNFLVAPETPTEPVLFTSCGFAKAVGQAYLDSSSDSYLSPRSISVESPAVTCPSVQGQNPQMNIQCDGDKFVMECQKEGPDTGIWIACRGGNHAVVYIY